MMKVLVAVKGVPDYTLPVQLAADGSAVETRNVRHVINPFDEIAVEEAVRLKEKGQVTEVIAVTIGSAARQEILRVALAMGADRARLLETDTDLQPLAAAKCLADVVAEEKAELILLGKQAVDTDHNQTGQMLAGLLGWSQGTFASRVVLNDRGVEVTREVDGGLETVQLVLPAVVTTDLRLNQPRYLSLPNIVQAKRKPLSVTQLDTLSRTESRLMSLHVSMPHRQRAGVRVASAAELVARLREARILE